MSYSLLSFFMDLPDLKIQVMNYMQSLNVSFDSDVFYMHVDSVTYKYNLLLRCKFHFLQQLIFPEDVYFY